MSCAASCSFVESKTIFVLLWSVKVSTLHIIPLGEPSLAFDEDEFAKWARTAKPIQAVLVHEGDSRVRGER
jgi:hypothetical protein